MTTFTLRDYAICREALLALRPWRRASKQLQIRDTLLKIERRFSRIESHIRPLYPASVPKKPRDRKWQQSK